MFKAISLKRFIRDEYKDELRSNYVASFEGGFEMNKKKAAANKKRLEKEREGKKSDENHADPFAWFKIPVRMVQDALINIKDNPDVIEIIDWCKENCENRWGVDYQENRWGVDYQLEQRWFPVFYFEREQDADDFMTFLSADGWL